MEDIWYITFFPLVFSIKNTDLPLLLVSIQLLYEQKYPHSLDLLKSFLIKGQCNKVRFIWFWKQNEVRDVLLFSSWDLGTGNARVVCFGVHLNNIFTANMGSQTFVVCNICSTVLVSKGFKRALKGRKQYILTSFINYLILALFLQTFLNFFLTL